MANYRVQPLVSNYGANELKFSIHCETVVHHAPIFVFANNFYYFIALCNNKVIFFQLLLVLVVSYCLRDHVSSSHSDSL